MKLDFRTAASQFPLAGVDGCGLMLVSEARASKSPGSARLSLRRANHSRAAGSGCAAFHQLAFELGSREVGGGREGDSPPAPPTTSPRLLAGRRRDVTCRAERVAGSATRQRPNAVARLVGSNVFKRPPLPQSR